MTRAARVGFGVYGPHARAPRRGTAWAAAGILFAVFASTSYGQLKMDLLTSTFMGAEDFDRAQGMTTDAQGNIYLHVNTKSSGLPTTEGAIGPEFSGDTDAYLAKYTPDGQQLIWATYMGGPGEDRGYGVQIGPDGSVYAVGITKSKQFPTTRGSAGRYHHGDSDFFVSRFTSDGELIFSTMLGGSGRDWSRGNFYVDDQGDIYIGGETDSPNFPVTDNAFQKDYGGAIDGFLVKLSADGSQLDYSTYFGGSERDASYSGVYVSPTDHSVYFSGMTSSSNFPTTANAYQKKFAGGDVTSELGDAYVARLSGDGQQLIFSTLLGGPGDDGVAKNDGMLVDSQGRIVLIGQAGAGFPLTSNASQSTFGGGYTDGFVSILSEDGSQLISSTLIGGNEWEEPSGVDVDSAGNVFVSGNTVSSDFPITTNAFQQEYGGGNADMILTVFSPDLSQVYYSSFIGGSGPTDVGFGDRGRSLEIVDDHLIILSGDTNSADFPLMNAAQTEFGGVSDAALLRWSFLRPGDANGDLVFDSSDLIQVFVEGEYEDGIPFDSDWASGDWDYDGDFTSSDLVLALQLNVYEPGAAAGTRSIPEPATGLLLLLGMAGCIKRRRQAFC